MKSFVGGANFFGRFSLNDFLLFLNEARSFKLKL